MSWCQFFKVQEEEERWLMYLYLPESLTSSLSPCVRRKKKASREDKKKRGLGWGCEAPCWVCVDTRSRKGADMLQVCKGNERDREEAAKSFKG